MGILIELGVFALVLAFAIWQWRDLRRAREEREARERRQAEAAAQLRAQPAEAAAPEGVAAQRAETQGTEPPCPH